MTIIIIMKMITIKSLIIIMKMMTIMQMIRTTIFQMILVKKMSLLVNVCLVGWSGYLNQPTCACQLEECPSLAWSHPHQAETQTAFCSTSQLVVRTEALGLHIMMMIVIVIMMMIVIMIVTLSTSNRKRNKDVCGMGLVWQVKIVSLSYCTGSITAFIHCKMYCRHHNFQRASLPSHIFMFSMELHLHCLFVCCIRLFVAWIEVHSCSFLYLLQ